MTKIVEYGDYSVDLDTLPEISILSLATKGLAHFLGNEVSSKTIASLRRKALEVAKAANEGKELSTEARDAIIKAVKFDAESAEHIALQTELRTSALKALADGTVGLSERSGPRLSPLETEIAAIVKRECLALVKNENVAIGGTVHKGKKNPEDDTKFNILGDSITWASMLARYSSGRHAPRIAKEAQAKLDADARKAAKLAKDVEIAAGSIVDLGL